MNDWEGYHRPGGLGSPLTPIPKRERKSTDTMAAGWGIAVGIALLIGWAVTQDRPDGHDWTGLCIEPTVQQGC